VELELEEVVSWIALGFAEERRRRDLNNILAARVDERVG